MKNLILYSIVAILVFIWSVIVFRSCNAQKTEDGLSNAKDKIENTGSGLSSNATSDEFEGEEDD
ncbi:MAG: hypothetical protein AAFO94_22105, partial [Bacteroidota bacterium]